MRRSAWFCRNFSRCHANRVLGQECRFTIVGNSSGERDQPWFSPLLSSALVCVYRERERGSKRETHIALASPVVATGTALIFSTSTFTLRPLCVSLPGFLTTSAMHCRYPIGIQRIGRSVTYTRLGPTFDLCVRTPLGKDKWIIGL